MKKANSPKAITLKKFLSKNFPRTVFKITSWSPKDGWMTVRWHDGPGWYDVAEMALTFMEKKMPNSSVSFFHIHTNFTLCTAKNCPKYLPPSPDA